MMFHSTFCHVPIYEIETFQHSVLLEHHQILFIQQPYNVQKKIVLKNAVHTVSFILISRIPLMISPSGKVLLDIPWSQVLSNSDETPLGTPFSVKGDPIRCLDETLVCPSNLASFSTLPVLTFIQVSCGWVLDVDLITPAGKTHFDQSPRLLILSACHKRLLNRNQIISFM